MPDDPFAAYVRKSPAASAPAQDAADPFASYVRASAPAVARKPAAAEDFMRPEDIANRDNGTSIVGDMARGFGKRALGSVAALGEMAVNAGMIPGQRPALFNPVLRNPVFTRAEEALAPKNDAETVGGRMELAAELAGPAIGAVKALPAIGSAVKKGIGSAARGLVAETPVLTQVRQAASKKVLGKVLDWGKTSPNAGGRVTSAGPRASLEDEIAGVLDELRAPEPAAGVELPPPAALPPGYAPRATVPEVAPPPVRTAPQGRLVPGARRSAEAEMADALAEVRAAAPAPRVTTPPPAELPPGYTPRSTVPKPVQVRQAAAEQARAPRTPRAKPSASPPPNVGPPKRAYFLKSEEEIAAAAEPVEAVTPTGSIEVADLPASWQSRVGQDLFPTTGEEAREITAGLREEIKARGMTIGQAIAAVSRNKDIPTKLRHQMVRSLAGSSK